MPAKDSLYLTVLVSINGSTGGNIPLGAQLETCKESTLYLSRKTDIGKKTSGKYQEKISRKLSPSSIFSVCKLDPIVMIC